MHNGRQGKAIIWHRRYVTYTTRHEGKQVTSGRYRYQYCDAYQCNEEPVTPPHLQG